MKITQSAKEKTKAKILASAVELIIEKGFENASLREMAKNAGVSNPTIYNYFPSKEKLLYAYVEQKHKESLVIIQEIEDFHTYTLREQIQTLIETELELYLEDREFVIQIASKVFDGSSLSTSQLYETNTIFIETIDEMFSIAIEAGEISMPPMRSHIPRFLWDYYIMVVAYWLKDESEMFENTSAFIDHSLSVIEALLASDVLHKASDLGMFFFKTHLLSSLQKFSEKKEGFSKLKKKLGEVLYD